METASRAQPVAKPVAEAEFEAARLAFELGRAARWPATRRATMKRQARRPRPSAKAAA